MNIKQNWDNSKLASYLVYDNWQPRKAMLVLAGFQMLDEWNNVDTRFALDPKSFDIPFDEMIAAQEEMNEKLKRLLDILDSSNLMYSIKSPAYFISWSISKNSPPDWLNWAIEKKLYTPDAPIKNEDLTFEQFIPHQNNAFLYVYEGEVTIKGSSKNLIVHSKEMAILTNEGDFVLMNSDKLTKLILISGAPLRESIVQYGPFVMNTKEQIIKAVEDFRSGQLA